MKLTFKGIVNGLKEVVDRSGFRQAIPVVAQSKTMLDPQGTRALAATLEDLVVRLDAFCIEQAHNSRDITIAVNVSQYVFLLGAPLEVTVGLLDDDGVAVLVEL